MAQTSGMNNQDKEIDAEQTEQTGQTGQTGGYLMPNTLATILAAVSPLVGKYITTNIIPAMANGSTTKKNGNDKNNNSGTWSNSTYQDLQADADKRLEAMRRNQINTINDTYDDLEKDAYITKMQADASLPAILASTGRTGGMAETTAVAPTVAYQNALTSYGKERAKAINEINLASDQQALQIAIDFADKIINQANIDRSYNYSVNSDQWNHNFQLGQFNYTKQQDMLSNQRNDQQYKDIQTQSAFEMAKYLAERSGSYQAMSAYGWTPAQIQSAEDDWKRDRGLL